MHTQQMRKRPRLAHMRHFELAAVRNGSRSVSKIVPVDAGLHIESLPAGPCGSAASRTVKNTERNPKMGF